MKRSLLISGVAVAMLMAWSIGRVQGQDQSKKVIFAAADKANYVETMKGVSTAASGENPKRELTAHSRSLPQGTTLARTHIRTMFRSL